MSTELRAAIESAAVTFVTAFIVAFLAAGEWTAAAAGAAVVTALRTLVQALNPNMPLYGRK